MWFRESCLGTGAMCRIGVGVDNHCMVSGPAKVQVPCEGLVVVDSLVEFGCFGGGLGGLDVNICGEVRLVW